MKKLDFIKGFIICMLPVMLNAQTPVAGPPPIETIKTEPIDDVQFIVQYEVKMILDTLSPDKITEESMVLKVGNRSSSFYSYTRYVTDSLFNEQIKKTGVAMMNRQQGSGNMGQITYTIYKNYPAGKVTTLDKIMINRYRCEEVNEVPVWQLLPDTMTIITYPCQKAICSFKGRDYEVWFTSEIPRSEGPWKLHGLPGLILKATDTQGHYSFECTGLTNKNEPLLYGDNGHESVSRRNLNRMYERFAADPSGYVSSTSPNVRIVMRDENGENRTMKNMPYNPIERDN